MWWGPHDTWCFLILLSPTPSAYWVYLRLFGLSSSGNHLLKYLDTCLIRLSLFMSIGIINIFWLNITHLCCKYMYVTNYFLCFLLIEVLIFTLVIVTVSSVHNSNTKPITIKKLLLTMLVLSIQGHGIFFHFYMVFFTFLFKGFEVFMLLVYHLLC